MSQTLNQKERMMIAMLGAADFLIKEHFPKKFHDTKEFEFTMEKNPENPNMIRTTEITAWTNSKRKVVHSHSLTQWERHCFAEMMKKYADPDALKTLMVDAPRLHK
jgi:hypothetical protein